MFKKLCIVILLLFLLNGVNSIRLIDPISTELTTDDYIGSASPGSTLELIFSKELGKFDSLKINSELPSGFDTKVRDYLETIKVLKKVLEEFF